MDAPFFQQIFSQLAQQEWEPKDENDLYLRQITIEGVDVEAFKEAAKPYTTLKIISENPLIVQEAATSKDFCSQCEDFAGEGNLDSNYLCEDCGEPYEDARDPDDYDSEAYLVERFADPGGKSCLWAASEDNPRIYACPGCGAEETLTLRDKQSGYVCDKCADLQENGGY